MGVVVVVATPEYCPVILFPYVCAVREPIAVVFERAPTIVGGGTYLAHGDIAGALAEVDRGIKLQGARQFLNTLGFWVAMNKNDRLEIERRLRSLRETFDSEPAGSRYYELAKFLDSPAGAEVENRRIAPSAGPNGRILLSLWAAYFHAPDLSLELLAKEATNGEAIPVLWQPLMRDVRKLPAFKDLARRSGLLDYWRAYGWSDLCHPIGDEDFACI
jgi:hypothetical protein